MKKDCQCIDNLGERYNGFNTLFFSPFAYIWNFQSASLNTSGGFTSNTF